MINPSNFKRLISPVKQEKFFAEYWQKKPLLIANRASGYKDLFSLSDFEFLLFTCVAPVHPWVKFVNNKVGLRNEPYFTQYNTLKLLDQELVVEGFQEGNTIVLNHLQLRWDPIKKLCYMLEELFGTGVGVNSYLTPANAQGFQAHRDAEEIFILQIAGEKLWKLYDYPLEYPLSDDPAVFGDDLKAPEIEVVLKPGDLLYIPRGYVHEAITANDYSLHLTVGIGCRTWTHLLNAVAGNESDLRKTLPQSLLAPVGKPSINKEELHRIVGLLDNQKSVEKAAKKLKQNFLNSRTATFYGGLANAVKKRPKSKSQKTAY